MQANNEVINQQLEQKWAALAQERSKAEELRIQAQQEKARACRDVQSVQASFMEELNEMRNNISIKISLINRVYEHYNREFEGLSRRRNHQPERLMRPPQERISNLSMEMSNLLRFECLSKKRRRLEAEYQSRCGKIKDEIKKLKLKISLTQLQINEAQKKSAKKSVKY